MKGAEYINRLVAWFRELPLVGQVGMLAIAGFLAFELLIRSAIIVAWFTGSSVAPGDPGPAIPYAAPGDRTYDVALVDEGVRYIESDQPMSAIQWVETVGARVEPAALVVALDCYKSIASVGGQTDSALDEIKTIDLKVSEARTVLSERERCAYRNIASSAVEVVWAAEEKAPVMEGDLLAITKEAGASQHLEIVVDGMDDKDMANLVVGRSMIVTTETSSMTATVRHVEHDFGVERTLTAELEITAPFGQRALFKSALARAI